MTPAFDELIRQLKKMPGLGYRSAERIALHLLVENPESADELLLVLERSKGRVTRCQRCGNISEDSLCSICSDAKRQESVLCVVEKIPDLVSMERSGVYRGLYHVLHGKLSPIHGVKVQDLNLLSLARRLDEEPVDEIILALSNDIEGEATCHYIQQEVIGDRPIKLTRIGFGLPSGSGLVYADPNTLKNALEGRRSYDD